MSRRIFLKNTLFTLILLFTASLYSHSQLCTGSLGDPVVNINFGTATSPDFNFTSPAAYTYTSSTCPNDGSYTITTSTSGCFGSSWHSVNSDHTGGGSFMLVNASYTPGDFFVTTVSNLCPNTTYEFASWVMNVLKSTSGIEPDLTFKVETPSGTILNQFNTGGIDATALPEWKQYGFFFTTTSGNPTIVLRITNNAPGGMGNDLALDDITFRPCGPKITSAIQGSSDVVDLCINEQSNFTFNATVSPGYNNPVYQWQLSTDSGRVWKDINGATQLNLSRPPTIAGNYWYRLSVAEAGNIGIPVCRVSSNILEINVHAKPTVNAGPDRIVIRDDSTQLLATVSGESPVFTWSPPDYLSDINDLNPISKPLVEIEYKLSATSAFGCSNEDYVKVKVVPGIFVPSAFTPNNDGRNDNWQIPYLDPAMGATVSVYNRYGQVVYTVTGQEVNWDGKFLGEPQPSGSFVYIIRFINKRPLMKGVLTLLR